MSWLSPFLKTQSSSPQTGRQVGAVAIWPASLHLACPLLLSAGHQGTWAPLCLESRGQPHLGGPAAQKKARRGPNRKWETGSNLSR